MDLWDNYRWISSGAPQIDIQWSMVEHQRWILSTPEWSTTDSKLTPCIAISMASELNTNTNTSIPTHCPQAGDFTIVCHTIQSKMFVLHPFSQKTFVPTLAFFHPCFVLPSSASTSTSHGISSTTYSGDGIQLMADG